MNCLFYSIYMIIAFVSIGFSQKLKVKSSIGSEIQNFYLDKHIDYIVASVWIWTFFLAGSYFTLYNDTVAYQSSSSMTQ